MGGGVRGGGFTSSNEDLTVDKMGIFAGQKERPKGMVHPKDRMHKKEEKEDRERGILESMRGLLSSPHLPLRFHTAGRRGGGHTKK